MCYLCLFSCDSLVFHFVLAVSTCEYLCFVLCFTPWLWASLLFDCPSCFTCVLCHTYLFTPLSIHLVSILGSVLCQCIVLSSMSCKVKCSPVSITSNKCFSLCVSFWSFGVFRRFWLWDFLDLDFWTFIQSKILSWICSWVHLLASCNSTWLTQASSSSWAEVGVCLVEGWLVCLIMVKSVPLLMENSFTNSLSLSVCIEQTHTCVPSLVISPVGRGIITSGDGDLRLIIIYPWSSWACLPDIWGMFSLFLNLF